MTRKNYIKLLLLIDLGLVNFNFSSYIFNFYSGLNNEYTFIITEK